MANRLETFMNLAQTYRDEIDKLDADVHNVATVIASLRQQLEAEEARQQSLIDERRTTITQLRGITDVIRAMEDRNRERRIAHELRTITATRKLEDGAYDDEV